MRWRIRLDGRHLNLPIALVILSLLSFDWGLAYTLTNSLPLSNTPESLRGRVISLFIMAWGLAPTGSTAAGYPAGVIGIYPVIAIFGGAVAWQLSP